MNFELITAKYDCRCSLTGKNFTRGDQVYYNYEAKTFLDPVYYENVISQQKTQGMQSYFQRHQKLSRAWPRRWQNNGVKIFYDFINKKPTKNP